MAATQQESPLLASNSLTQCDVTQRLTLYRSKLARAASGGRRG